MHPLASRPHQHPLYPLLQQLATHSTVLDVGCGPGKDLIELVSRGVPPHHLIGIDIEPQFGPLSTALSNSRGLPPFAYIPFDIRTLRLPPLIAHGQLSGLISYRFIHLHPPPMQQVLLNFMLSVLSPPFLLIGLHRALPPDSPSSWTPISTITPGSEKHWLWNVGDWERLLEGSAKARGDDVEFQSRFLEGGEGRGAVEWSVSLGLDSVH